jgi:ribonuclease Z
VKVVFFGTCGAVPSAGNGNTSFAVMLESTSLLVDTSGTPVQSLLRASFEPASLDGVVLTHAHTDHLYGLPSLLHALWLLGRQKPLAIYCNAETAERGKGLCDVLGLLEKPRLFPVRWVTGEEIQVLLPGAASLRLFPVQHSTPTCGLAIREGDRHMVYSSDTGPCERIVTEAASANALIHEASATTEWESSLNAAGHSSGRQAAVAAGRAGARKLFLCHVDLKLAQPRHVADEAAAAFPGTIVVPTPFTAYEL